MTSGNIFFKTVALVISSLFFLTGCLTPILQECGRVAEHVSETKSVRVSDDGTYIFSSIVTYRQTYNDKPYTTRKRFLIVNLDANQINGIIKDKRLTPSTVENKINLNFCDFDHSFKIVPSDFLAHNASDEDLPEKYKTHLAYKNDDKSCIPWSLNDQKVELCFDCQYDTGRQQMLWWAYPARVLVLPAIFVDVVLVVVASPFLLIGMAIGGPPA